MRLGYYSARTPADLEKVAEKLDVYGLSAAWADIDGLNEAECAALGDKARALDIVLGEAGMWENLLTGDAELRARRIDRVRRMLCNAERAGVNCVVTVVGSTDASGHMLAPHPDNYTDACKREFREIVLRILDGLELTTTRYALEPWHNTFFYQPDEIKAFLDEVGHPALGLHLDQMNMVSQPYFFRTGALIETTFALLADRVCSVHLKDIACDPTHMFLKWDEVRIGEGVMNYDVLLRKLATLDPDMPCYCEHFAGEGDYAISFARLHHLAARAGVAFHRRAAVMPTGNTR